LQAFQEMDGLIVDTPGVSPAEEQRLGELRQILEPLKAQEVHLVLNACTREKDLVRVIESWKGLPVNRLVFTRLDEAGACGHLLNLLLRNTPAALLSGHRTEDSGGFGPTATGAAPQPDLAGAGCPPQSRGALAGPEGAAGAATGKPYASSPMAAPRFYHRPDCKWVCKIKPEHLLQFASAAEAEFRQFTACRNCDPHRGVRGEVETTRGTPPAGLAAAKRPKMRRREPHDRESSLE